MVSAAPLGRLIAKAREDPTRLQPLLQELSLVHPELLALVQTHQADFMALLNGGAPPTRSNDGCASSRERFDMIARSERPKMTQNKFDSARQVQSCHYIITSSSSCQSGSPVGNSLCSRTAMQHPCGVPCSLAPPTHAALVRLGYNGE